jgi:hypothetical protein
LRHLRGPANYGQIAGVSSLFFLGLEMVKNKAGQAGAWAGARLGEASTWKGIGWLLVAAGVVPVGAVDGVVSIGLALVGVVEVLRSETK